MPSYVTPKKNTAFVFYIGLMQQADTRLLKANPTLAAADFNVSIDGGALAALGTTPTVTPASGRMVKISLSASEMNGDNITVVCSDASGAEWCDQLINIQTSARQVDDLAYPATSGRSLAVSSSGVVDANVTQIDAQATSGNNATLNLKQLNIVNNAGSALVASSTGSNGHGIAVTGHGTGNGFDATGGSTSGAGIKGTGVAGSPGIWGLGGANGSGFFGQGGNTNGHGAYFQGNGSAGNGLYATGNLAGHGFQTIGGATGNGMQCTGGSTSGSGLRAEGNGNGAGIVAFGTSNSNGMHVQGAGTGSGLYCFGIGTGSGIYAYGFTSGNGITAVSAGTGHGMHAGGGVTSGDGLRVSAGVDGCGLNAIGNSNKAGIKATGGATGHGMELVGGATSGDGLNASITSGVEMNVCPRFTVQSDGGNSATQVKTDRMETINDNWIGSLVTVRTGDLKGQVVKVSDYDGTTKIMTFESPGFTTTPANGVLMAIVVQ